MTGEATTTAVRLEATHPIDTMSPSKRSTRSSRVSRLSGCGTRTVHPPAGSNPVIVFLGHSGWGFFLFPVLSGALTLILIGWLYNNAVRETP